MPVAPETVQILADAIEAQRAKALGHFEVAARALDDVRARLRFAVGDTDLIAGDLAELSISATSGITAFDAMMLLAADLRRLVFPPTPVPTGMDKDARVEVLRIAIVGKVDEAQGNLDALGTILRNETPGTTDDVLRLAASIRQNHDNLQTTLSEALEVSACAGSA